MLVSNVKTYPKMDYLHYSTELFSEGLWVIFRGWEKHGFLKYDFSDNERIIYLWLTSEIFHWSLCVNITKLEMGRNLATKWSDPTQHKAKGSARGP